MQTQIRLLMKEQSDQGLSDRKFEVKNNKKKVFICVLVATFVVCWQLHDGPRSLPDLSLLKLFDTLHDDIPERLSRKKLILKKNRRQKA